MNRNALLTALPSLLLALAAAQPSPPGTTTNNDQYSYARFSPSMAIIIVVLIAALFFMGFFSVYIRHCSDSSTRGPVGSIRRALSRAAAAAARGLDSSVLETFPTFTYSEVRDHKIGKGALECAVCLNEFEPEETLRLIPKCDHVFHMECIDAWLDSHVTCPVCRANLVLDPAAADHLPPPPQANDRLETRRDSDQIAVQVDDGTDRPRRSVTLARPKIAFGLKGFRSHSTGHSMPVSVVQPGENLERFTLRLPEQVRQEVMDRSTLNRTGSSAVTGLPRGGSSRSNRGRSYRRIEREGRSDRWLFFSRGLSMKSPKVVAEDGEGSSGASRSPIRMPSFKCLEPKAADEAGLFSTGRDDRPPV